MISLTLFRHASAVSSGIENDFDRPLRKKGIVKTRETATCISQKGYYPDLIISSSALRAVQTAEVFAETITPEFSKDKIVLFKSLYLPSALEIIKILRQLDSLYHDVFLFSHNNGISDFARILCGENGIIMPTGAALRIDIDIQDWSCLKPGIGRLIDFIP